MLLRISTAINLSGLLSNKSKKSSTEILGIFSVPGSGSSQFTSYNAISFFLNLYL